MEFISEKLLKKIPQQLTEKIIKKTILLSLIAYWVIIFLVTFAKFY
jgi:hypothetical protein